MVNGYFGSTPGFGQNGRGYDSASNFASNPDMGGYGQNRFGRESDVAQIPRSNGRLGGFNDRMGPDRGPMYPQSNFDDRMGPDRGPMPPQSNFNDRMGPDRGPMAPNSFNDRMGPDRGPMPPQSNIDDRMGPDRGARYPQSSFNDRMGPDRGPQSNFDDRMGPDRGARYPQNSFNDRMGPDRGPMPPQSNFNDRMGPDRGPMAQSNFNDRMGPDRGPMPPQSNFDDRMGPDRGPMPPQNNFNARMGPDHSGGVPCACFILEEISNIPGSIAGYNQKLVTVHAEPYDKPGCVLSSTEPYETRPQTGYGQQSGSLRMVEFRGQEFRVELSPYAELQQGRVFLRLVLQWCDRGGAGRTRIGQTDSIEVTWQPNKPSYYRVEGQDAWQAGCKMYMGCRLMDSSAILGGMHNSSRQSPQYMDRQMQSGNMDRQQLPPSGYMDWQRPPGTMQLTEAEQMARMHETYVEPQVMDGVVAFMEFQKVTDLPIKFHSNLAARGDDIENEISERKVILEIKPEDNDVVLGRAGPYHKNMQTDGRYYMAACEDTTVIVPVLCHASQSRSSRFRIALSYGRDEDDGRGFELETIGSTEPFSLSFEGSSHTPRRGQIVKHVSQVREYKIVPDDRRQAEDFALTRIHLAHRLVEEEKRYYGEGGEMNAAQENDFRQRGVASSFYIVLDRITDLPAPAHSRSDEGQVILVIESASNSKALSEDLGPFRTSPQVGGHFHKADLQSKRVDLKDGRVRIFVSYVMPPQNSGRPEEFPVGQTMPIDLAGPSQMYYSLCDNAGRPIGSSRLYMTFSRFERGADGRLCVPPGQYGSGCAGPQGISTSTSTLGQWPQEALRHLESPASLDEHWNVKADSGVQNPHTDGLKLVAGSFHIAHPDKFHGGMEKEFMNRDGLSVGIFELHEPRNRDPHYNPAPIIRAMAETGEGSCHSTRSWSMENPKTRAWKALQEGVKRAAPGVGAGIVAALNAQGSELGVAKVGHLVLWQVRKTPGTPVTGSHARVVAHAGDYYEHSPQPEEGNDHGLATSLQVEEGDLIVLGSDGVFHNLHDKEMCDLMEWTVSPHDARQQWDEVSHNLQGPGVCTHPAEVAAALAKAALYRSQDTKHETPYAQRMRYHGGDHEGGITDDITVVCAWLARVKRDKLEDRTRDHTRRR